MPGINIAFKSFYKGKLCLIQCSDEGFFAINHHSEISLIPESEAKKILLSHYDNLNRQISSENIEKDFILPPSSDDIESLKTEITRKLNVIEKILDFIESTPSCGECPPESSELSGDHHSLIDSDSEV